MSEKSLSYVGAFAYLFNSFSAFSVFLIPYSISIGSNLYWYQFPLILVFVVLSLVASQFLIGLTDLVMQERIGSGPGGQLLPVPIDQRRIEIDVPSLSREGSSGWFGDVLYVIVVICCLLGVVDMSLVGVDSARLLESSDISVALFLGVMIVAITILNMFDFVQLELLHIAITVCRLVYWGLRPNAQLKDVVTSDWLFYPCLTAAFFYQLPLPGILTALKKSPKSQYWLQVGALVSYLIIYVGLTFVITRFQTSESQNDPSWVFIACYFAFKVLSPHIYWKTLGRIVIAWHFGTNLSVARDNHPTATRMIEMFIHWPVYVVYFILRNWVTHGQKNFYLECFYPWVAFITVFVYWSLVHAYDQKIATFSDTERMQYSGEIPKLVRIAAKWTFGLLCLVGAGYIILTIKEEHKIVVLVTGCAVLLPVAAMLAWNVVRWRKQE